MSGHSEKQNNSFLTPRIQIFSKTVSLVVASVGLFTILGWVFDIAVLKGILPNLPTMKVNTALCFLLGGASLWLWHWQLKITNGRLKKRTYLLILILAFLVTTIALLTLIQYGFHLNLGIDEFLMQQPEPQGSTAAPGRMAPNTALAFFLEGFALLLLLVKRPNYLAAQGMAVGAGLIGYLGVLGYVQGSPYFYTAGSLTGMAIHTASCVLLLSSGILCARPDQGLMLLVCSNGAGGLMARRLLPLAIVLPPLVSGLYQMGYYRQLYSQQVQTTLSSASDIILFSTFICWSAHSLNRFDCHRRRAEQTLQLSKSQLEQELCTRQQVEAALQASQARFAGILEIANDAIISVDANQRITLFNQGAEKLFGYATSEVLGQSLDLLLPERFGIAHRQHVSNFGQSADTARRMGERQEIFGRRKDRSEFPAEASISKLKIGEEIVFTAFVRDITDQKRVQEVLRLGEERLQLALEASGEGLWDWNIEAGEIYLSPRWIEMLGYDWEELPQEVSTWDRLIHPDDKPWVLDRLNAHLKDSSVSYAFDYRLRTKSGEWKWVADYGKAVVRDENGLAVRMTGTHKDISNRKRTEEILRESEERFRRAFDDAAVGMALVTTDGHWLQVNRSLREIVGYTEQELLSSTFHDITHPDDLEIDLNYARQLLSGEIRSYQLEKRYFHKQGHVVWILLSGSLVRDTQGNPLYFIAQIQDISDRKKTQEALAQSERLFRILAEISPVGIFRSNASGQTIYANQRACQLVGVQLEDVLGWKWSSYIHPEDRERVTQVWQHAVAHQLPWQLEYRLLNQEGRVTWVLGQADVEQDNTDTVVGYVGTLTDISDRKASEEALRQSESTLRSFFNSGSMLMGIVELYDNDILHISDNQVTAQFFGTTPEAMQNQFASDLGVPQASLQMWLRHYRKAQASQAPVQFEYSDDTPNSQQWLFASVCPIGVSPNGYPRFSYIVKNISDRKRAEKSLRRYKRIVSATTDAICLLDRNYTYQLVNQAYLTLLDKLLDEIIGHSVSEILGADRFETFMKPRLDRCLAGEVVNYQMWFDYPTLGRQFMGVTYSPYLEANHKISGVVVSLRNLTELKQAELELQNAKEAAEVASQAKSIFLANMSHELRTPLNVILGFTQVMSRDVSISPEQRENLQIVSKSGHHLLTLINDVLDLSKIEAGRITLDESSFDLIGLVRSLQEMLRQKAENKGFQLNLEIAPDIPPYVIADPNKLRQVLLNLLSNAIKFTQEGRVTLKVKSEAETPTTNNIDAQAASHRVQQTRITFEVSDTGVGIPPTELDTIFDAFVQTQAGKTANEGTGLGLTISRKFVQLMGGDFTVKSTPGQGSIFSFEIPVRRANASQVQLPQTHHRVIGLAPGQPLYRILIVDDQPENRQLLVKLLTHFGLEVQEAANGQEALTVWQEWQPHLIWMDIRMPVMDGYEATQQIRSSDEGRSTVIIALTAQVSNSDRDLALKAGCNDYISKPFQEEELFAKMAEHLGLRYVYASGDQQEAASTQDTRPADSFELTPESLSVMPSEWINQLHKAAKLCDDEEILHLLEQISSKHASLIANLSRLARDFQFGAIAQLTRDEL